MKLSAPVLGSPDFGMGAQEKIFFRVVDIGRYPEVGSKEVILLGDSLRQYLPL